MKDEWNNECPYDFKNMQFKKSSIFLYTFGGTTDDSLTGGCHHNVMMEYTLNSVLTLNFNTFGTGCYSNTFDTACHSNTFGNECYSNTFSIKCDSNTFGNDCYYNTFGNGFDDNIFGNDCYSNMFGDKCNNNTFGNKCHSNTFGNSCDSNTFDNNCYYNMFGDNCASNKFVTFCSSNTFGDNCASNIFLNYCNSNTFGDNCNNNTFDNHSSFNTFGNYCRSNVLGNSCGSNTFGNYCYSNNFYADASGTTIKNYIKYIVLEDGCRYNNFYSALTTSNNNYLQRIRIKGLEHTTPTTTQILLPTTNTNYDWLICRTSDEAIKQYCPDDRLLNNYTYKLEDIIVSTWTPSAAYAGYDYQARIDIQNLTESDLVEVIYSIPDAESTNYAPDGELYDGYIKIFAKVNTEITIPAIIITKIDL